MVVVVVVGRGCSIRFSPLVSTILATNSLCHQKTGTEREGRTGGGSRGGSGGGGGGVGVCVGVEGGGGREWVLTHSFSPFVNVITGNEFCLCHWKVERRRKEGQVVEVVVWTA